MAKNKPTDKPVTTRKSTKGQKRGPITSFKDIVMALTLEGMDAVNVLRSEEKIKKQPLKSAIKYLRKREKEEHAKTMETLYVDMFGAPGERGRDSPKAGESRPYKVQQVFKGRKVDIKKDPKTNKVLSRTVISEGEPQGDGFIRLPLGVLGVKHGAGVIVYFENDEIKVRRKDDS